MTSKNTEVSANFPTRDQLGAHYLDVLFAQPQIQGGFEEIFE
jgi:hypothetical protein